MEVKELQSWLKERSELVKTRRGRKMSETVAFGIEMSGRRLWYMKMIYESQGDAIKRQSFRFLYDLQCQYRTVGEDIKEGIKEVFSEGRWGRDLEVVSLLDVRGAETVNDHITDGQGLMEVDVTRPLFGRCEDLKFDVKCQLIDERQLTVECRRSASGGWLQTYILNNETDTSTSADLDRLDKDIAEWISING